MMKYLPAVLLLSGGCKSIYPLGGSVVGGAGGAAMGGIPGAALGAGAGWGAGKAYAVVKDNENLTEQVKALTTGDIDKLVELKLEEKKESGFFDSILGEVYDFLTLALLALVAWNVVPLLYTWMSNKKVHKKINGENDAKSD